MNSFQQKIFNEFVSNNKLSAGDVASLKKYIEMYGFDGGLDRFKRRLETLRAQNAANVSASTKASAQAAAQAAEKAASAAATAAKVKAVQASASRSASSKAAAQSAAKAASAAAQAAQSVKQVAETVDRRAADHEAYLKQAARREILRVKDPKTETTVDENKALEDLLTATAASEQAIIDDAKASAQAIQETAQETAQAIQETAQETAQAIDGKKAFIIVACIGGAWWLWRRSKKKGARRG